MNILRTVNEFGQTIHNGYTEKVHSGDGDFLTRDCIWDFKVSKNELTTKNSLQLGMYYLMGKHSGIELFEEVDKIGIYNPRLNCAYVLDVKDVHESVWQTIESDIIGYNETIFT